MAIDWNDNTNRKAFREALQAVYPSGDELELFADEELNVNLATITEGANLQITAHGLMKWAKSKGKLDEVYQAFKEQNPTHSVIKELERGSVVAPRYNLAQDDWDKLFGLFLPDDLADLKRAFNRGFQKALGLAFQQARPNYPALSDIAQIRELLEIYDIKNEDKGPVLAVRFVDYAIAELRRSSEDTQRDLTDLEQWRDRIAKAHKISPSSVDPSTSGTRHAYLLVALKESGRQTQKDGAFVTVFAELQVTGEPAPIAFDTCSVTCSLDEVAGYLSELIKNAEVALIPYECGEVTLELFLPCVYLEENIAAWEVKNEQNRPRVLGMHRGFLVRSLERALNRTLQTILRQKWKLLTSCMETATVCDQFHCQEDCPDPGILEVLLDGRPGLHFLSELPADQEHRLDIFYDIINSAVPIALWSAKAEGTNFAELKTQFDGLLGECQVTNFADLARTWRRKRIEPDNEVIKHVRLLCDCPDRWPNLPDPNQEEDLLVAS